MPPSTTAGNEHGHGAERLMRSGTAARLAGLSPSTLRIWEHRYSVVAPPKSATGQRTYSMNDVERLRLVKRLTLAGHAIGTVARLEVDALVALVAGSQAAASEGRLVLVAGEAVGRKLNGCLRPAPAWVFDDLAHAQRELVGGGVDAGTVGVLVAQVSTLDVETAARVSALAASLPGAAVIVVYAFGTEALAESLHAAGMTVRREPVTGKELARLITAAQPPVALALALVASAISPGTRRFSDAELVALTEMPSTIACECPRHLAEIVTLLVGFERYSAQCASLNAKDAALHRHLGDVTSAARSMLEQALDRVVIEEGLAI